MFYQIIVRLLLSVCGLGLADYLFEGVRFNSYSSLFWAAMLLAMANTFVRPLLIVLTLPMTILSLGLFLFVVNALTIGLVAWVMPDFYLSGFWSALATWFCVAMMQAFGSAMLKQHR